MDRHGSADLFTKSPMRSSTSKKDDDIYIVSLNDPAANLARNYPSNYIRSTKYTILTFLPKNLFEQFRRVSNLYFLAVIIIQLIPSISPVPPVTSILPLVFVLTITAIKEAYEDYFRHKEDKKNNLRPYSVIRNGTLVSVASQSLRAGDIVRVDKGQDFPADLVLLSSSNDEGHCHIETANLDGETNLKLRKALDQTAACSTVEALSALRGAVECEPPNERLYHFNGRLVFTEPPPGSPKVPLNTISQIPASNSRSAPADGSIVIEPADDTAPVMVLPLGASQLLQRGAQLRNTAFVWGVVVYAGVDTKLCLNQQSPPSKFSTLERQLNRYILFIFLVQMAICVFCALMSGVFEQSTAHDSFYLGNSGYSVPVYALRNFFTYFILFNVMIPISLWVTLEVVKVGQAKFMEWDAAMMLSAKSSNDAKADLDIGIDTSHGEGVAESASTLADKLARDKGIKRTNMSAKTSNLNEDLGRIQHIFSDKTGTLTENNMLFCKASVRGQLYSEREHPGEMGTAVCHSSTPKEIATGLRKFLEIMALCHSVVPEIDETTGKLVYQAQSPDEAALVNAALANGVEFAKRTQEGIFLRWKNGLPSDSEYTEVKHMESSRQNSAASHHSTAIDKDQSACDRFYQVLAVLDFTPARRRMSVIVRTPSGKIRLLCKGADVVIFNRLVDNVDAELREETIEHLRMFSTDGFRTLVMAEKELTEAAFQEWKRIYDQAISSLGSEGREERIESACELIENELVLVGCSAIEDKLQDEVPETIAYLLAAGIQLWVLTGDKQETAINIGYSSHLLHPGMRLLTINAQSSEQCGNMLNEYLEKYVALRRATEGNNMNVSPAIGGFQGIASHTELGLVIDGQSLSYALQDHTDKFLELARACYSVICCRVTPLQKALVVRMVKQGEHKISLAIGDGANDVSMIQEAHVGVGIYGREGTQAARASDYAIQQFKHLRRLLSVHGRYSYVRNAGIIQYSFYKNIAFTFAQLWFSFFNGFTGQTLYDSWVITVYNIIFTSVPPLCFGLFEKDLSDNIIDRNPEVYRRVQRGVLFTKTTFGLWLATAALHSLVIFFGTYGLFSISGGVLLPDGKVVDHWTMGTVASTAAVIIVNLRIALETKHWTWLSHVSIWGSIGAYFIILVIYNLMHGVQSLHNMYWVFFMMLRCPTVYFLILVLCVVCLMPVFGAMYFYRQYFPPDWQILKERYKFFDVVELVKSPRRRRSITPVGMGEEGL